jgi:hypothetical protein
VSPADRELADRQAELVRSLNGEGTAPAGFDADRVGVVAESLVRKRLRAVRQAWPGLATSLGGDFETLFKAFAAAYAAPRAGGALADGERFTRWLEPTHALADGARVERLAVALHFARTPDGLRRRRRWSVAAGATWLPRARTLVVAVRLFGRVSSVTVP